MKTKRSNKQPTPAALASPRFLLQSERIDLMMPLAKEAKRLLRVAKAKGDTKLLDCAVDTLGAIIEAV